MSEDQDKKPKCALCGRRGPKSDPDKMEDDRDEYKSIEEQAFEILRQTANKLIWIFEEHGLDGGYFDPQVKLTFKWRHKSITIEDSALSEQDRQEMRK